MAEGATPHQGRVVVGVDGSQCSKKALLWGARMAAGEGVELAAIAVWETPVVLGWPAAALNFPAEPERDQMLETTVKDAFDDARPAGMVLCTLEGDPAKILLAAGEGALMLVVGRRGFGGFAHLLLGSVSAKVVAHANCPVLVVH